MAREFRVRDIEKQKDVRIRVSRENKDYVTIRIGPGGPAGRRLFLKLREAEALGQALVETFEDAEKRPNYPEAEPRPGDDPLQDDPDGPAPGTPRRKFRTAKE